VYSVSNTSVAAYSLDALAGPPLSRVDLPNTYYYGGPVPPPVIITAPTPADEASE
jgi:hypothetical protein